MVSTRSSLVVVESGVFVAAPHIALGVVVLMVANAACAVVVGEVVEAGGGGQGW